MEIVFLLIALSAFTTSFSQDKKLQGTWDNEKGQVLVFNDDNSAFWIFYAESKRDTFKIKYEADFSTKPYKLNLTNFSSGPLKGKTLFGIVEYTDNTTIRFDCEPGLTADVRPTAFDPKQTQTYRKQD